MTLSESIAALVNYGVETGLTPACEKIYTTNLLLDIFHEDDYEEPSQIPSLSLPEKGMESVMIMKNHHRFHPFLWKRF